MEEILKDISTNYIKLAEDKEHDNNVILHSSLRIIEYMKRQDPLFKAIFDRVFFGGSYHDRLNIGKPNKFKLDLLFDIEEFCEYDLPSSKIPCFIHLEVIEFTGEREERATVRQFRKLFDDRKYLCTGKVLGWMENVLRGAFEELKDVRGRAFLETIKGDFKITFTRKASALRLLIHTADGSDYYDEDDDEDDDKTEVMSIDLVPCFVFNGTMWPRDIRYNNVPEKDEFFIVPEIPTAPIDQPLERYWRLSFQEQERVLINDKGNLKPTIKLLEKLRDKYKDDYITSYYIKTMFLHIVEREPDIYWNYPLSCLFMDALKELKKYIESRNIPQYWYKGRYNLTSLGDRQTLANRLECMIKDIENTPRAVAKYLLKPQAYEKFMRESVVVRVQLNLTNMENVLQEINRKFISLPDDEVRRNNRILESILGTFIDKMKTEDPLFKVMFRRVFYGGSYYDGLRVGKPEEFDLDLLLQLPVYAKPVLTVSNIPGFVHLQLENFNGFMKQPEAKNYRNFKKLFDEECEIPKLTTDGTLAWMEGLVQRSLNKFPFMGGVYLLRSEVGCFDVKVRKGGPALTLQISGMGMKMDVDLVACFVFGEDKWPADGFSSNPFPGTLPEFFIVPKPLRDSENKLMPLHWRLSFQEQERKLIDNKNRLKPTIKLLKKLRDNLQHTCIASYYIKTVLLHIISLKDDSFWNRPLSQVFIIILREYKDFITDGLIRYYWNSKNNLIGEIKEETLQIMSQRLSFIIQDIENNRDIPTTVAKHLLTRDEYRAFVEGTAKDLTTADPPTPNESSSCLIA